eukprot:5933575-Prymnesium_polylepis.1
MEHSSDPLAGLRCRLRKLQRRFRVALHTLQSLAAKRPRSPPASGRVSCGGHAGYHGPARRESRTPRPSRFPPSCRHPTLRSRATAPRPPRA